MKLDRSYIYAAVVAVAVGGWLASGSIGKEDEAGHRPAADVALAEPATTPAPTAQPARDAMTVRVRTLTAEKRPRAVVARGRTAELRMVDLRAEVPGRVIELPVREGARVRKGDVIARLDKREREAQVAETRALVKQRELEYSAARTLHEKGYRAETKVLESAAQLEAARSALSRMEVQIENTIIRAPFDGVVEVRHAELGAYLKDGDPIARLVDRDPLLVVAQLAEREVGSVQVGDLGKVSVVTGDTFEAKVRYIATMSDPATRTFRVELEAPNADLRLRAGLTAEVRITAAWEMAHFVSPAMLTLDDAGRLGVKAVDAAGVVRFHPAQLLSDGPSGAWLSGLPETLNVITVGQEYVRDGDRVATVADAGAAS